MEILKKSYIGNMELNNRIFLAPVTTEKDWKDFFSKKTKKFIEERAEGGVGLVITGGYPVLLNENIDYIKVKEELKDLAKIVHNHNAKICLQITPGCQWINYNLDKNSVNEISEENIKILIDKLGKLSKIVKEAGIDAVEINGSGGNLLDQFHTKRWNKRRDGYGGSLENRMRFTQECINAVKNLCGEEYPLIFKFTPFHGDNLGTQLEEGQEIAKILEESKIDALHVDIGYSDMWYKSIDTVYQEEPGQVGIASKIKDKVSVPVLGQGKLSDPEAAEKILKEGKLDFIGMAHQLIADPDWVKKIRNNTPYDIVHCISCNDCLGALINEGEIKCSVNPLCYNENIIHNNKSYENKYVLVLGGGPGGITAALSASEKGAQVELWEKTNELGGNFLAAGNDFFKKDIRKYLNYLNRKLFRSKVKIKMLKEGNIENIDLDKYDKIIVATGSRPVKTDIKGRNNNVSSANEILTGDKKFGRKVAVIGGGLVGCEVAGFCGEKAEKVFVFEILDDILVNESPGINDEQALRKLLKDRNVEVFSSSKVVEVKEKEIVFEKDGEINTIEIDTVIGAEGYISNSELYEELGKSNKVVLIGDAIMPANVIHAIHQGYKEGRNL